MSLNATLPSPLDGPRHFDDEALSAWTIDGRTAIGPKSAFAKTPAYGHGVGEGVYGSATPKPNDGSTDPIAIELVRGANGPNGVEGWTVVVDGLRYPLIRRDGEAQAPYVCIILPPGVNRKQPLTVDTKVRPVALTVRLEEEAARPLSAQVEMFQVLRTDELVGQEGNTKNDAAPVQLGAPQEIPVYRVSDVTTKAVITPYPSWAPAQSVLGILSLKSVQRWEEHRNAMRAQELFANAYNAYVTAEYSASVGAYSKVSAPTLQRVRQVKPKPDEPSTSFIIGGKKKSVARELVDMFDELTKSCQNRVQEAREFQREMSLIEHLKLMRLDLEFANGSLKAFFDALMSTEPYPPTKLYLEQMALEENKQFRKRWYVSNCNAAFSVWDSYQRNLDTGVGASATTHTTLATANVNGSSNHSANTVNALTTPMGAGGDGQQDSQQNTDSEEFTTRRIVPLNQDILTVEQKEELAEEINVYMQKELQNEMSRTAETDADHMFTYERLAIQANTRTTVRTHIRVQITDFDGSSFTIEFEAAKDDGVVAHAVYAELKRDVDDFDQAANAFVDCVFDSHAEDGQDTQTVRQQGASALSLYNRNVRPTAQFGSDLWGVAYYIPKLLKGSMKTNANVQAYKFDPCRLEERLAELRIMIQRVLPIWPPEDDEVNAELLKGLNGEDAASADKDQQDQQDQQKQQEDLIKASAQRRKNARSGIIDHQKNLLGEMNTVIFPGSSTGEENQEPQLMIRSLPQIVVLAAQLHPRFLFYSNMDPPKLIYEGNTFTDRWSSTLGTSAALVGGYLTFAKYLLVLSRLGDAKLAKADTTKWVELGTKLLTILAATAAAATGAAAAGVSNIPAFIPIVTMVTNIASSSKWFRSSATDQALQLNQLNAVSNALPIAANFANMIYSFATNRAVTNRARYDLLIEHRRIARGKPVASAVAAANTAMSTYKASIRRSKQNLGTVDDAAVVYNAGTGTRFMLHEYYRADSRTRSVFEKLFKQRPVARNIVSDNDVWSSVPSGNAISLFPPLDVADALFDAEELRGLPIGSTIAFTAGVAQEPNANSPATLAARAAHQELSSIVIRARKSARGERLMQSAAQMVMQLTEDSTHLLRAVYSPQAGVTLVTGSDLVWRCARAGTAARLAIRHLVVFQEAEAQTSLKRMQNINKSSVEVALDFWKLQRRQMVEAFAKAWLAEARSFAKNGAILPPLSAYTLQGMSTEAARRFARTRVLIESNPNVEGGDAEAVEAVVQASVTHRLYAAATPEEIEYVQDVILTSGLIAKQFDDQADLAPPKPMQVTSGRGHAAWASRRVAPAFSRNLLIGSGGEAASIVEQLSALDISEAGDDKRVYYCPVGGRMDGLPSKTPFAIDALESRLVWMEQLENAAALLADSLQKEPATGKILKNAPENSPDTIIRATSLRGSETSYTGFARHPLSLSVHKNVVHVRLSHAELQPPQNTSAGRTRRMRTVAYNAERLLFALSLAVGLEGRTTHKLAVEISYADDALALAIAMAVLQVEIGLFATEVDVYVAQQGQIVQQALENMASQASGALSRKCKVCSLAEVTLCL